MVGIIMPILKMRKLSFIGGFKPGSFNHNLYSAHHALLSPPLKIFYSEFSKRFNINPRNNLVIHV